MNAHNFEYYKKHIHKLVDDLGELLNQSEFCDVEIKVGVGQNVKVFKAHSVILKARSSYFKTALSNNWYRRSENSRILFINHDISPRTFEVILKYIYNGIINKDILDPDEIIKLILAFDVLEFSELANELQDHLFKKEKKWVRQNLNYLDQITSNNRSFRSFRKHIKNLIDIEPELFLKADDFKILKKSTLVTILEEDCLDLKEIFIWDHVIQWGIAQIENLDGVKKNISEWNENNIEELRNILEDIIPLFRFQDITSEDFRNKVMPYQMLFPAILWSYISDHWLISNKQLTSSLLSPRNPSKTFKRDLVLIFASWIDRKYPPYNLFQDVNYEFKLLYRSSRDGLKAKTFHKKCNDINKTLVVGKIKNSDRLIGGYNPLNWNGKGYKYTNESFIFNISNRNDSNTARISHVINNEHAIYCDPTWLPVFGSGNGQGDVDIAFYNIGVIASNPGTYDNINLVNGSKFDELEIFQVIDKN